MIYIPDPMELMEMREERMADEYIVGDDEIKCSECGVIFPIQEASTIDPHPVAAPVCPGCLQKALDAMGEIGKEAAKEGEEHARNCAECLEKDN